MTGPTVTGPTVTDPTGAGPTRVVVLDAAQHREAAGVFGGAYLVGPITDRMWARSAPSYAAGTVHGVLEADGTVGAVTRSFPQRLAVPGGELAATGVSSVGVRADRRRRGYLRALMTTQLTELRTAGSVAATLRATEAGIYSRFGYGVASSYTTVTVDRARARLRADAAVADVRLDLLDPERAGAVLGPAHDRLRGSRPGTTDRPAWWWHALLRHHLDRDQPVWVLTASAGDEVVGWVAWTAPDRLAWGHGATPTAAVLDLVGATPGVELALWQAALGIDLVDRVEAGGRALDDVLPLALADPRAVSTTGPEDETWLRLLDVGAALATRSWAGPGSVVLEVADALLPDNAGRYRVGPDGVARTDDAADVALDVAELACVYLGGTTVSDLLAVGRVRAEPAAAAAADALLRTPQRPWSGTYF